MALRIIPRARRGRARTVTLLIVELIRIPKADGSIKDRGTDTDADGFASGLASLGAREFSDLTD